MKNLLNIQPKAKGCMPQLCGNKKAGVRTSKLLINLSKEKKHLNLFIFSKKNWVLKQLKLIYSAD